MMMEDGFVCLCVGVLKTTTNISMPFFTNIINYQSLSKQELKAYHHRENCLTLKYNRPFHSIFSWFSKYTVGLHLFYRSQGLKFTAAQYISKTPTDKATADCGSYIFNSLLRLTHYLDGSNDKWLYSKAFNIFDWSAAGVSVRPKCGQNITYRLGASFSGAFFFCSIFNIFGNIIFPGII